MYCRTKNRDHVYPIEILKVKNANVLKPIIMQMSDTAVSLYVSESPHAAVASIP